MGGLCGPQKIGGDTTELATYYIAPECQQIVGHLAHISTNPREWDTWLNDGSTFVLCGECSTAGCSMTCGPGIIVSRETDPQPPYCVELQLPAMISSIAEPADTLTAIPESK